MHFARGFKRLFNHSPPSQPPPPSAKCIVTFYIVIHFCFSSLLFPLFCMLFSFLFHAWTICTLTMTISLLRRILFYILLKPVYFNYSYCLFLVLIFVFFSRIFTFFRLLTMCARLNWSVGGDSTDVLLNSLKFNISQVGFLRSNPYKIQQIDFIFLSYHWSVFFLFFSWIPMLNFDQLIF